MSNQGAMTNRELMAAVAAGLFSAGAPMAASAADAAKIHCQGVEQLQGQERLFDGHQRMCRPERLQGQRLDRDDRERVQGQGRNGRQVSGRGTER